MAKFITGQELNDALYDVINTAETELILMCPYFKLNREIRNMLTRQSRARKAELAISIIYGKNENNEEASLSDDDLNFFKQFPNIGVYYMSNLHAKFYANEKLCLLTSMNLHASSIEDNVEYGYLFDQKDYTTDIRRHTQDLLSTAEVRYKDRPRHKGSSDNAGFLNWPPKKEDQRHRIGYCIRCGREIEFDLTRPMCPDCFKMWNKFGNPDYSERYCHYSGEESRGETCFARPVMRKNWRNVNQ